VQEFPLLFSRFPFAVKIQRNFLAYVDTGGARLISIVVPCFNCANSIGRQVEALLSQSYAGEVEILLVNNRSSDSTGEILRNLAQKFDCIQYVDASSVQGINHARNCGIRASRGEVILFCDADDVVQSVWIERYAQAFRAGAMLAGGGLLRSFRGDVSIPSPPNIGLWSLESPAGANCGMHRSVVETIGYFDESYLGGGDETDFFWRAQISGFAFVWLAEATVEYVLRSSAGDFRRQQYMYGRSHAKLYREFRSYGMPQSIAYRSILSVFKSVLELILSRSGTWRNRNALGKLSLHAGRLAGSIRFGVVYL